MARVTVAARRLLPSFFLECDHLHKSDAGHESQNLSVLDFRLRLRKSVKGSFCRFTNLRLAAVSLTSKKSINTRGAYLTNLGLSTSGLQLRDFGGRN